ncbi:MAG: prolyl oligopeptidase family serine peptidase, partial [Bacillota bacterium]
FPGDVLIIHGTHDVETPLSNARLYENALRNRAQGRYTLKLIEGADHTYNSPLWEKEVIEGTVQWLTSGTAYNVIKKAIF